MADHIRGEVARRRREHTAAEEAERLALPVDAGQKPATTTHWYCSSCAAILLSPELLRLR
jgi:hypothetical protein